MRAAVLVVPAVNVSAPLDTYVSDSPNPFVGPSLVRTMQNAYLPDEAQRRDSLASPALAGEALAALPPLLVLTAQHDSVRPQQERFVSELRARGVNVTYRCFDGVDHDFGLSQRTPKAVWDEFESLVTSHLLTHLPADLTSLDRHCLSNLGNPSRIVGSPGARALQGRN